MKLSSSDAVAVRVTRKLNEIPKKVYHTHIPKTAGTSLNSWLNDGASANRVKPDDFDGELTRWLKTQGIPGIRSGETVSESCWDIYDVLHGHRNLMYGRQPGSFVLTILREPVARSISLFFDLASLDEEKIAHLQGQMLSYRQDYLRLSFSELRKKWGKTPNFRGQYEDYMCRFFLRDSVPLTKFLQLSSQERFVLASQIVTREIDGVGLTEAMDSSIHLFSQSLGRYPVKSLPRYNFGRPKTSPITDEDKDYLATITDGDRQLWQRYSKLFDSLRIDYSVEQFEKDNLRLALLSINLREQRGGYLYDMNQALVGDGFWGRDNAGGRECRRWTGPKEHSVLYLPAPAKGLTKVAVNVAGWQDSDARNSFSVRVWGRVVGHNFARGEGVADVVEFLATPREGAIKIEFFAKAKTDEECQKRESDGRRKGLSLKNIVLSAP